MKQAIGMGILAALFMTALMACGNSAESNLSQEVQDMTSNTVDAEYEEEHTDNTVISSLFTIDTFQRKSRRTVCSLQCGRSVCLCRSHVAGILILITSGWVTSLLH